MILFSHLVLDLLYNRQHVLVEEVKERIWSSASHPTSAKLYETRYETLIKLLPSQNAYK